MPDDLTFANTRAQSFFELLNFSFAPRDLQEQTSRSRASTRLLEFAEKSANGAAVLKRIAAAGTDGCAEQVPQL